MDSGDLVVSSVRAGMKREFAMMMKAQLEMGPLSVGPRRMTRSQSTSSFCRDMRIHARSIKKVYSKRLKKEKVKLQAKNVDMNIVDAASDDEGADGIIIQSVVAPEINTHENVVANLVQPLCAASLSDAEIGIVERVDSEASQAIFESMEKLEMDKGGTDLVDGAMPDSSFEVSSQVVSPHSSAAEFLNIGFERNLESTTLNSEATPRRFTRSSLKVHMEDMELGTSGPVIGTDSTLTRNSCPSKLEMKMSQNTQLKRTPKKLKELLNTGLLEGLPVRYVHGVKINKLSKFELRGVIQGTGILCSCNDCNGSKVVTPNKFELHAHSGNKRPPEYIYLENGKSLRDVINACKANISESLDQVILNAIGRINYTSAFCLVCKGVIPEAGPGRPMLLCNSCVIMSETNAGHADLRDEKDRSQMAISLVSASPTSEREVLESDQTFSNNHRQLKCKGKLTRKDLRMHKYVFSEDILPDGTALSYFMHGKKRLEGVKKDGGILCMCCNELVSPSQFEAHAGFPARRKPYMSIYTSNGVSLHQLSLELSKTRRASAQENDDLCSICEDGGDLLCCENCPRAFHSECVGLLSIPQGTWYCKYCQNMFEQEKFAEHDANAIAAGRVPGVDPLAEISQRCIRIVGSFAADIGGCAICREHDFSSPEFTDRTVIICDQCEKEYHVGCLREQAMDDLKALPDNEWFCSKQCSRINCAIQKLVSEGEQNVSDDILRNIKKSEEKVAVQEPHPEVDIKWRVLSGKDSSEDTRVWLSGAVSIFHDRFDPIADSSTGRLDLIPHMVYGRHFKDQDFCGMHCAILTVNSIVVSAGLFRIFGEEVAELPLVATRSDSQGKGYFQLLFYCIERFLKCQNVKELVLPAAYEAESLWKNRFGFERLGQEQLNKYKRSYQMMIFEGTAVLRKSITSV